MGVHATIPVDKLHHVFLLYLTAIADEYAAAVFHPDVRGRHAAKRGARRRVDE